MAANLTPIGLCNTNIKQEPETDSQYGASQEAHPYQNFNVKQEFYPQHTQSNVQMPVYASPYFNQAGSDCKYMTQGHEAYNGQNSWNVPGHHQNVPGHHQNIQGHHQNVQGHHQNVQGHQMYNGQNNWNVPGHQMHMGQNSWNVPGQEVYNGQNNWNMQESNDASTSSESAPQPKKRGRKPKAAKDKKASAADATASPQKERKKRDRFNGVPEEEVAKKFLPDHLAHNLDILIIGINPGLYAAHVGHHYAGPGNHFWKCMYLSGLIPEPFNANDDHRLLELGIGFTNVVARTTRGSTDLSKQEMKQGCEILKVKIQQYRPRIAVFNGKTIYEMYCGTKKFCFGRQPVKVEGTDTHLWVMPSSSARCAQLPRALDKVPFYAALRKFLDYLLGRIQELDEAEVVFTSVILTNAKKVPKIEPGLESNEGESSSLANVPEQSTGNSPAKGRKSPQKRKSEQPTKSKKKS